MTIASTPRALQRLGENLYCFADTCNVYVVQSGDACLLIDLGDGGVLDHLAAAGIRRVEWVLHTHHHRDQCQGDRRLPAGTRIAVPRRELHHFSEVEAFWQSLELDDRYLCANVFSTLATSIPVTQAIADDETFSWSGIDFLALPTPGHTRGSLTYLATIDGTRYAFCGDLIHSPGRLWTLHDLHWDYSVADGVSVAQHSTQTLQRHLPERLAPSHGEVIEEAAPALAQLADNLERFYTVVGRGYEGDIRPPIASETHIEAISQHLTGITHTSANFYALTADSGRTLLFDYGFASFHHVSGALARFTEHSLDALAKTRGINGIDTVVPTHYHDDHVAGFNYLRSVFNTNIWAPTLFADILRQPAGYRLPATWGQPTAVDATFEVDDELDWEEYRFTVRHVPGHTWYAVAYLGEIDGRRIAISGDQIQRDADGRLRGGGPVYPNRVYSGDFAQGISAILDYQPELLLTGHDGVIEVTAHEIDDLWNWCHELEDSWRTLAAFPNELNLALDPSFIRVHPYRSSLRPGETAELEVIVDNHHDHDADVAIRVNAPSGWVSSPASFEGTIPAGETATFAIEVASTPSPDRRTTPRRSLLTLDARLGEQHLGEIAEALLIVATV